MIELRCTSVFQDKRKNCRQVFRTKKELFPNNRKGREERKENNKYL